MSKTRFKIYGSRSAQADLSATLGVGFLFLSAGGMLARADALFNFTGLSNGATTGQITTYMNGLLPSGLNAGASVAVTGAVASQTWTGDDHVVGVCTGTTSVKSGSKCNAVANPITLADGDAGKTFIMNDGPGSDRITMDFTGLTQGTYTFSFNLEIFPDGTCPVGTTNGSCNPSSANWPDLELGVGATDALAAANIVATWQGVIPGTGGTSLYSPASVATGAGTAETSPQLLGASGNQSFTVGANGKVTLEFIDWPAEIGIDNLDITPPGLGRNSTVPETSSVLLLATVSGLLIPLFRRLRKA